LLKLLRNCISDAGTELILRVHALERPFLWIGPACNSLPLIKIFYRRAVSTLCNSWKRDKNAYREIQIEDCKFIFDATDFTVCNWYFYRQLFEPETTHLILETLKLGDTVLDIGSNRGYMSVLAAKKIGSTGRVFCFEPNPVIYQGLKEHLRLNQIDGCVEASTLALSNSCSRDATFFVSTLEANSGLSSLTPHPELLATQDLSVKSTIVVETITLDDWIKEKSISQPIDFIKVDVEGAEMLVLEGAKETLATRPPKRWVIETQPTGPAIEFMKTYGYRSKILDPAGDHVNILFTHQSYQ